MEKKNKIKLIVFAMLSVTVCLYSLLFEFGVKMIDMFVGTDSLIFVPFCLTGTGLLFLIFIMNISDLLIEKFVGEL